MDTDVEEYTELSAKRLELLQIPEVREFERIQTELTRLYAYENVKDYVQLKFMQEDYPMQSTEELQEALRRIKERRELAQFEPTQSKRGSKPRSGSRSLKQAATFDQIVKGCGLIKGSDEE